MLAACLATSAPVVVAPAMDGDMWTHPATRINVERLRREFGYRVVEPGAGPLASGQNGIGRLAELDDIVDAVVAAVADAPIRQPDAAARPPIVDRLGAFDLEGRRIVVTAGGTAEADRPRAAHRQPQHRQDGHRDRRGRPRPWRARDADRGPPRGPASRRASAP